MNINHSSSLSAHNINLNHLMPPISPSSSSPRSAETTSEAFAAFRFLGTIVATNAAIYHHLSIKTQLRIKTQRLRITFESLNPQIPPENLNPQIEASKQLNPTPELNCVVFVFELFYVFVFELCLDWIKLEKGIEKAEEGPEAAGKMGTRPDLPDIENPTGVGVGNEMEIVGMGSGGTGFKVWVFRSGLGQKTHWKTKNKLREFVFASIEARTYLT